MFVSILQVERDGAAAGPDGLPTAYYLLPTTYYLLPTTYYLLASRFRPNAGTYGAATKFPTKTVIVWS